MAGRNPAEAVDAFVKPLVDAINCLTEDCSPRVQDAGLGRESVVTFGQGLPLKLQHRSTNYGLTASLRFKIVPAPPPAGPFRTTVVGYTFELRRGATPTNKGDRVIAYHHHPRPTTRVQSPHCHLGLSPADVGMAAAIGSGRHLPTGRITLEEIVVYLIDEVKVVPARADWRDVVKGSLRNHRDWRTWH